MEVPEVDRIPPPEIVQQQRELTQFLGNDERFIRIVAEPVGKEWVFKIYLTEERPPTRYKGTPVIFEKKQISKRES